MARQIVNIVAPTVSMTNITGFLNIQGLDFVEEVAIYRGFVRLISGYADGPGVDVIPGNSAITGDIKLTSNQPALQPGEFLVMEVTGTFETIRMAPTYLAATQDFGAHVWAEREGRRVNGPSSCQLSIKEGPNNLVFSFPLSTTPNGQGIFSFVNPSLALNRGSTYFLEATLTESSRTITVTHPFTLY